tara:strand:+ start:224 stop:817 length:594 start_codon:yes stop_codon:yes gene_type:complete
MIRHRLFPKGEYCHALISSPTNPNILFQVRGLIYDVKMDEHNPQYKIKIIRFYDDINFLKRYFFSHKFKSDFRTHTIEFKFNRSNFDTRESFEDHIKNHKNWQRYMVVVDSVMCTKTSDECTKLYNTVQSFLIEKGIKDLYESMTRTHYRTGKYHFESRNEFGLSLKRFFKSNYDVTDEWIEEITDRPSNEDLDFLD